MIFPVARKFLVQNIEARIVFYMLLLQLSLFYIFEFQWNFIFYFIKLYNFIVYMNVDKDMQYNIQISE